MERAVARGRDRKVHRIPSRIGVDEKSIARGHKYESLVYDIDAGTVEFVWDDRGQQSLENYYRHPAGLFRELFTGPKEGMSRALILLLAPIFFAAGCVEVISILLRPVALCFRLYGNIFAGDTMLETMANLVPGFGWLVPIPFYFMELLMGFVQAMVFMLLAAVFTLLECPQPDEAAAAGE